MFNLFLGLFDLFVLHLDHILLLLDPLDGLFELALNLVEPAELMLEPVLLDRDLLHLLHQRTVLLGQLPHVPLQLRVQRLLSRALRPVLDYLVLCQD